MFEYIKVSCLRNVLLKRSISKKRSMDLPRILDDDSKLQILDTRTSYLSLVIANHIQPSIKVQNKKKRITFRGRPPNIEV